MSQPVYLATTSKERLSIIKLWILSKGQHLNFFFNLCYKFTMTHFYFGGFLYFFIHQTSYLFVSQQTLSNVFSEIFMQSGNGYEVNIRKKNIVCSAVIKCNIP